jgi:hypothetical protein
MGSAVDSATDGVMVCIPWRPQPHRLAAFERVVGWYEDHGYQVVLGDSHHETFNLAAARNAAVRAAGDAEIVVVADADTIPEARALMRAIRRATSQPMVVYPFEHYVYLGDVDPATVDLERLAELPHEQTYTHSVGGLLVVQRQLYWELGGHDEGFRRWGYEDTAFEIVAETLARTDRITGSVYAFGHEADRDMSDANPGRSRIQLYRYARRNPKIMRELVHRW